MGYSIRVLAVVKENNHIRRFFCEKPEGYLFKAGQSVELGLTLPGMEMYKRPFSFANTPEAPNLEFIIKDSQERTALCHWISKIQAGDILTMGEPFGGFDYKGPGYFIAGGSGIAPFLCILRQLKEENRIEGNKLLFSVRNRNTLIAEKDLRAILDKDVHFHFSRDIFNGHKRIDGQVLTEKIKSFDKYFYLCGPDLMVENLKMQLINLGAAREKLITESYLAFNERLNAA